MTTEFYTVSTLYVRDMLTFRYGSTGCWVIKRGVQNWKDFCLKINMPKRNYWILRIGLIERCQELDKIKWFKVDDTYQKKQISNTKLCSYIDIFQWKKLRKIWMIFDIENWLWKSNFGTFESLPLIKNS